MDSWIWLIRFVDALWTLIAVIGISVSLWALIDGYIDGRILRIDPTYNPYGPRILIVRINLRSAIASLILHLFFLFLGILAFLAPVTRPGFQAPAYLFISACYILVAFLNVRAVGLNQLDRVRLRRMNVWKSE